MTIEPVTNRHQLNPNLAISVSCAPNPAMPRSFDPGLWEAGTPGDWYTTVLERRILASNAGMVFLRNPGGMEETGDMLLFDQLTQCQNQSGAIDDSEVANRMRTIGEHSEWAWVCGQIRSIKRRVALYLGAVSHWDSESPREKIRLIEKELTPFFGYIDECYVDCGNEASEYGAYPMVSQVCKYNGIICGGENRALPGKYSYLMNHPHCVIGSKWDATGGAAGDRYHAPVTPDMTCWILSDDKDVGKVDAQRYMSEAGKCAVGIWDLVDGEVLR